MKVLDRPLCVIEDRRMPTSMHKPSGLVEMTCEDCRQEFLIIFAGTDTTNFTSVCKACWDERPVLTAWKCGGTRDISVGPNEDLEAILLNLASREYECAVYSKDESMWELDTDGHEHVVRKVDKWTR